MTDPVSKVYEGLEAESLDEARNFTKPPVRIRASEAADCSRKIYYRITGHLPTPKTAWLKLIGMMGDIEHDVARQLLEHFGVLLDGVEKEVTKDYEVDGVSFSVVARADGYISIDDPAGSPDNLWALLEIKSMGGYAYKYLNDAFIAGGNDAVVERVRDKHKSYLQQCTVTAVLHDKQFIYLLVKDRSMSQLGLYDASNGRRAGGAIWKVDTELWEKLLKKFGKVAKAVKNGTPPRAEYADGSKECGQCDFYYLCHGAMNRKERGITPEVVYPIEGILRTNK